ncbi:hypothetical protein [Heyndrickxia acidicola]|uniref:Uncharacterized protein n=1 Tax=Heyndrickxia acidicola TaxID=209389 RepID=A0ABU6MF38_9BACI|nr:hypothetical protein [Heyndrickxia acidicola]MED1203288.1 hypothetical protein [Heyndrickxia acidicola]
MFEEVNLGLINLFSQRMKKTFNTSVVSSEVSYKSLNVVNHNSIYKKLITLTTLHTLNYSDNKRNQWNAGFVVEEVTRRLFMD